jgi:hypothetical protein
VLPQLRQEAGAEEVVAVVVDLAVAAVVDQAILDHLEVIQAITHLTVIMAVIIESELFIIQGRTLMMEVLSAL